MMQKVTTDRRDRHKTVNGHTMNMQPRKRPTYTDFSIEDADVWRFTDPVVDSDLRYFEEKTGGKRLPCRGDLKPEELKSILPEIALFEPIYDEDGSFIDVRGLLEGTKLDSFYGSITGKLMSDYPNKLVSDRILQACRHCVDIAKPIVVSADALSDQKNFLKITVLYVPMSENGTTIDRIFIHNQVKSKHRD